MTDSPEYFDSLTDFATEQSYALMDYTTEAAETTQSASPDGLGAATVIALAGGGAIISYKKARDKLKEVEEEEYIDHFFSR